MLIEELTEMLLRVNCLNLELLLKIKSPLIIFFLDQLS